MGVRRAKPLLRVLNAAVDRAKALSLVLLVLGTLGAFCLPLASKQIFFDENALNIGSSRAYIRESQALVDAQQLRRSFLAAAMNGTAFAAAHAAMAQLSLDPAWQPVSGQSLPKSGGPSGACANLHGILRAPRGDGKEALVLVTPLGTAVSSSSTPSGALRQSPEGAALVLALGYGVLAYLSQVPWLAKDVIWVVSDARCSLIPAVEAWMDEYQAPPVGMLPTRRFPRGGLLQQAIVIEAAGDAFNAVQIPLVAGAGQLPKLDLFYLLRYYAELHVGIPVVLQDTPLVSESSTWFKHVPAGVQRYAVHIETLVRFAVQQASGRPTGAHAAFKPYGVDSVTLRLVEAPGKGTARRTPAAAIVDLAQTLELVLRSLNGLQEKFHHSYFLYILVSVNRFITVEIYIIPLVCLILVLPLLAASMKQRIDLVQQPVTGGVISAHSTRTATWLFSTIAAVSINAAFIAALVRMRACVLAGWPGSVFLKVEALAHEMYRSVSDYVTFGFRPYFESLLGAVAQVSVLAAIIGLALLVLLPCLLARSTARKERTHSTAEQHSSVGLTARTVFCRRVFLLICVFSASELAGLACVNWAASYTAAALLIPVCMLGHHLL